jgi:predicted dienelactone hydrolase
MKHLLTFALAAAATLAQAGVGLAQRPGTGQDGPVTLFYPTAAADEPVTRGPFVLQVAPDAAPARGNGRLVVISHGSGGAPWVHTDLARTLVQAGFVVALPEHRGDNHKDMADAGPASWKRRPAEVSRAIDVVLADAQFGPLVAGRRVGVFGGSAGGHTALTLAGGRWSPAGLMRHCQAHVEADFASCAGYTTRLRGNLLDGFKKQVVLGVIRQRFDDETPYTHHDPRIGAVIAAVPYAADFDMESFKRLHAPLGLVAAGRDINQVPRFHVEAVRRACAACETVASFPEAGHGIMLSPMPPADRMSAVANELNGDPPGFDRPPAVQALNRAVLSFFQRHLLGSP